MSDMKKLHPDANLNAADLDGDGIVTEEELSKHERLLRIENDDQKEDAQRGMAWFALFGMLLYPFAVVLAGLAGLTGLAARCLVLRCLCAKMVMPFRSILLVCQPAVQPFGRLFAFCLFFRLWLCSVVEKQDNKRKKDTNKIPNQLQQTE